jgi:hypothetical protein
MSRARTTIAISLIADRRSSIAIIRALLDDPPPTASANRLAAEKVGRDWIVSDDETNGGGACSRLH